MDSDRRVLDERFGLPGVLWVEGGGNEALSLRIEDDEVFGRLYLLGGLVTHWQPADQEHPVLFLSEHADFSPGQWVHGGVPICYPWFGDHPTDPDAPGHGSARTVPWELVRTSHEAGAVVVEMACRLPGPERGGELEATYRVRFGRELGLRLTVTNRSEVDERFEAALHTYLAVGDIDRVRVEGLEDRAYFDGIDGKRDPRPADGKPLTFAGLMANFYQDVPKACALVDPVLGRRIVIEQSNAESVVVWTPGPAIAEEFAAKNEFGLDEWRRMCCIESANIDGNAVILGPGESHTLDATFRVEDADITPD